MSNKITYVSALTSVIEGRTPSAEEMEKLVALRESVAKRNSSKSHSLTKTQKENAVLVESIANAMESETSYSIKDICGLVEELNDATSQKVAPLMASLVESGRVVKSVVKGKNYYTLA